MNLLNSKNSIFDEYKNIICIGNKTELGITLIKILKKNLYKPKLDVCINEYYDSKQFLNKNNLSIKEKISEEKIIVFFFATGGVRTINHSTKRALKSLKDDLSLLKYLNKYYKGIKIVYVSSVLGLIISKKNTDYSLCKKKAELDLTKISSSYQNITNLYIIYPGRLINNWIKFFVSGSITYNCLANLIIRIISKKDPYYYCLAGLDAILFVLIKRPIFLKDMSFRIM